MQARVSRRAGGPRRLLIAALIAVFFVPTTSHAIIATDSCGPAGPDKATAPDLATVTSRTCVGDTAITPGPGVFNPTPDDWYKFTLQAPASFGLRFQYGGDRASLSGPRGAIPATALPGEWHLRLSPGEYYLKVATLEGFVTEYAFTYDVVQQNDCGTPGFGFGDAGNTRATASQMLVLNTPCHAQIWASPSSSNPANADPEDWYRLDLTQGTTLSIEVLGYADVTDGCGTSEGGAGCGDTLGLFAPLVDVRDDKGAPTSPPVITTGQNTGAPASFSPPKDGSYFLRVSGDRDWIYQLTVTNVGVPNTGGLIPDPNTLLGNDQCAAPDAGNTSASAAQLATTPNDFSPASCYGFLGQPETDAEDWYQFEVTGTESGNRVLNYEHDSDTVGVAYEIRDSAGAIVVSSNGGVSTFGIPQSATSVPLSKNGIYKLRLFAPNGGSGRYQFLLDVRNNPAALQTPPVPTIPAIGLEALNQDSCATPGNVDASNTKPNAAALTPVFAGAPGYCYGSLGRNTGDAQDWYKFTANKFDKFSFLLSGDGLSDPNITLFRPNGTVFPNIASAAGAIPEYTFQTSLDAGGVWTIRISQGSPAAGNYLLTYDWRADLGIGTVPSNLPTTVPSGLPTGVPTIPSLGINTLTDDCNQAGDANNTKRYTFPQKQPARAIPNQTACMGSLGIAYAGDTTDWYAFNARAGQMIALGVSGDVGLDPILTLYTPTGARVTSYPNVSPIPEYLRYDVKQTGLYRILITRANNTSGRYGLFVGVPNEVGTVPTVSQSIPATPSLSGDCNGTGDAPSTKPKTSALNQPARDYTPNNACTAALGGADRDDWYRFGASAGQHFSLNVGMDYGIDVLVYLVDPRGIVRAISANGGLMPESIQNYVIDRTGTWKLKVQLASGGGKYYMGSSLANY